ncbi:tRNA (guanine-N1)-methyltransferase [Oscillatoria sp. CS-180]|uniref:tRNA (guanine-N1)-methyltransferase n=1 Tax=Oscillatoria sp. CS-180 TaxID=3021720 RepID=UPI002330F21E|nr:tRNA (guanine-N1)-methyltransferase [Oscillatoria sp. CS-180]MDB9528218.1 tRNA (guanine-N1)-methyltransferase [Oscillatoria sp. CS-180]
MSEWCQEGQAKFRIEGSFYRRESQTGRDLAVLAAAVYRQQRQELRVLDAMTGCGVRPLRYQLEAGADWVWANEGNPELHDLLQQNLEAGMRSQSYRITHEDANHVFFTCYQQRDFYDLVDIDSFGGGAPYLATGLWATRLDGFLYLTSTDTRTTGGHNPDHSVRLYGAYARPHPASHEQGARLLIGSALQQAASRGMVVQPIFSLYNGHVHRVMVRLSTGQSKPLKQYGFLGYCHHCGHYQTLSWRQLGKAVCHHSSPLSSPSSTPLTINGPLWLGALHDCAFLAEMSDLAQQWGWHKQVQLLQIMQDEAEMPPYYFTLPEIGRRGQMDIPKREHLMTVLRDRGFRVSRTHLDAQAIKSDANIFDCIKAAKSSKA